MSTEIRLPLPDGRTYTIHAGAGALDEAGDLLAPFTNGRVAVVTDENVARHHYPRLAASLERAGLASSPVIVAPGEEMKSFRSLEQLVDALLVYRLERGELVAAFGGGVIGDLAGFAAGIYKRGVALAQIPTTLLAQVDASIGGKTGINTAQGKNLVGLFNQPRIVITDPTVLGTLPRRELLGGYAEIAKYGLLGDAEFFSWLENHAAAALNGDSGALVRAVEQSCRMKAAIVSHDERETGDRALLNLGHTFGHALEAATGYSGKLSHGEGVAIGCVLAFVLSHRSNLCSREDVDRVRRHFESVGLPTRLSQIPGARPSPNDLLSYMQRDKKATGRKLTFVLARGVGRAFIARDVPIEDVVALLQDEAG
ncbi:MAG: 3-dehydroquinate synthase [Alphaproteobacteria bacterium]